MQITFTNATADILAVAAFYKTLAVSESVTVSMSSSGYDGEAGLKALVEAGSLTIDAVVLEAGDTQGLRTALPVYSNTTRPAFGDVALGTQIWNTDDGGANYSDGSEWLDSIAGTST
jgi:hypothetical protein